jgi:hypothetical protein
MSSAPEDWQLFIQGYNAVQNNGVPVTGSPGERVLNIIGAESIDDNPSNGSTDITLPTASNAPTTRVAITGPDTRTAALYTRHVYALGASGGTSVLNLPTGAASGVRVSVKLLSGTISSSNKLTVNAPSGGTIEELPETTGGVGGVFGSSTAFALPGDIGSPVTWECDGANNWEIV